MFVVCLFGTITTPTGVSSDCKSCLLILTAARQGTDYRGLRTFFSIRQLTMDQPMCVDIAITDDLKVEGRELFRVYLFPRTSFGVDALFTPRRTTVVIVDDDAPSKYTIISTQ